MVLTRPNLFRRTTEKSYGTRAKNWTNKFDSTSIRQPFGFFQQFRQNCRPVQMDPTFVRQICRIKSRQETKPFWRDVRISRIHLTYHDSIVLFPNIFWNLLMRLGFRINEISVERTRSKILSQITVGNCLVHLPEFDVNVTPTDSTATQFEEPSFDHVLFAIKILSLIFRISTRSSVACELWKGDLCPVVLLFFWNNYLIIS